MKKTFTNALQKYALLIGLLLTCSFAGSAQTNFYVATTGNDANNGLSPATSKLTIQNAVNTAAAGDIINIADGVYNARVIITKSLTLLGDTEAGCIINGTGLVGTGKGILINNGVTNVSIRRLTVQNFTGANGNSDAGIYAIGGNNNLDIEHVTIQNNVGGSGFYANGPVDNVVLDFVTSSGHTVAARGIVIWNGLKSNIRISNCQVFGNNCCGIELQDGSASGVIMTNNNVYNNSDNGMSAIGLDGTVGTNLIANNTLNNNGRFGIEIKNPNGSTTVTSNTVNNTTFTTEVRDGAGIAVYRRGVLGTNVDIPTGVKVTLNTVSGYKQPSTSEGFGIVIEGTNHQVLQNNVSNCDVGIQQQAGNLPYPGDGDQNNKVEILPPPAVTLSAGAYSAQMELIQEMLVRLED
jgi:parallel beta-helix repeat protein